MGDPMIPTPPSGGIISPGPANAVPYYGTGGNTLQPLAVAANSVFVTDGSNVPSFSSTLPSAVQGNIVTVGTVTTGVWSGTNVAAIHGGTGLSSFTSGGILYASSTTTLASSGLLTANAPVIGGGAGGSPTVGSRSGNTTIFTTASGTLTAGNSLTTDASGNVIDGGLPLGSGTVNTGTINDLAYYASSTNAVSPLATANNGVLNTDGTGTPSVTADPIIGNSLTVPVVYGGTDQFGLLTLQSTPAASTGNDGILFCTAGAASRAQIGPDGTFSIGTGIGTSSPQSGVLTGPFSGGSNIAGGNLYIQSGAGTGTTNSGSLIFQTAPAGSSGSSLNTMVSRLSIDPTGGVNILSGSNLTLAGSSSGTISVKTQAAAGTYNFNLPITAGTSNQPMLSRGGGSTAMTWGSLSGNTSTFATTSGTLTSGHVAAFDANGNIVDGGAGGGGTVSSGTINQLSWYAATGTTVSGLATANNGVLVTSSGGVPSISSTLPAAVQGNITTVGTITTGVWNGTGIDVPHGGTGAATFTSNGVLYGNGTSALQVTAQGAANTILIANAGAPSFSATPTIGTSVTTPIVNITGSSSGTITVQAQAAAGTYNFNLPITAGISGKPLISSGGGASAMTFATLTVAGGGTGFVGVSSGAVGGVLYMNSTSTMTVTLGGAANTLLTGSAGVPAFSATPTLSTLGLVGGTSGTVTIQTQAAAGTYNFNLPTGAGTSGQALLSGGGSATAMTFGTLSVGAGGTGITSGTSGGIPYFSASSTIASSAALTANLPVIGGGAGVAPTVGTVSGNTTKFVTTTGALTSGHLVSIDASGNFIDSGSVGGGSVTVFSGTDGGTANARTVTSSSFVLTANNVVVFEATSTNTGATTANVNGTGSKNIYTMGASGPVALAGNEIVTNNTVVLVYDGTEYQLINPAPAVTTTTYSTNGANTFTVNGNVKHICALVWGAGGGGASGQSAAANGQGGGGGGGGMFATTGWIPSPGAGTITATVGAGGPAGTGSLNVGTAGGNSTFGSYITAFGGGGGINSLNASTNTVSNGGAVSNLTDSVSGALLFTGSQQAAIGNYSVANTSGGVFSANGEFAGGMGAPASGFSTGGSGNGGSTSLWGAGGGGGGAGKTLVSAFAGSAGGGSGLTQTTNPTGGGGGAAGTSGGAGTGGAGGAGIAATLNFGGTGGGGGGSSTGGTGGVGGAGSAPGGGGGGGGAGITGAAGGAGADGKIIILTR